VIRIRPYEFGKLVREALASLPEEFARAIENVAVVVEDEPTDEELESVGLDPEQDDLFGLYQGVPLPERGLRYEALPDRIVVYRLPILYACDTREQVVAEVRTTVIHELGHYFGLDDAELPA
jgi:predicted Zn-dependent protease with MMP-like domain